MSRFFTHPAAYYATAFIILVMQLNIMIADSESISELSAITSTPLVEVGGYVDLKDICKGCKRYRPDASMAFMPELARHKCPTCGSRDLYVYPTGKWIYNTEEDSFFWKDAIAYYMKKTNEVVFSPTDINRRPKIIRVANLPTGRQRLDLPFEVEMTKP